MACDVEAIHVAGSVNRSAERLRDEYIHFVAEIPERVLLRGKNLKELFAVDDRTSMWWFSLIAEKNPYKSDTFNRLAQMDLIIQVIKEEKVDALIFGCRIKKLESALWQYCKKNHIRFSKFPVRPMYGLKNRMKQYEKLTYLKHMRILISSLIQNLLKTWIIKRRISPLKRRISQDTEPLLFLTPYPNIDIASAQKGVFKNKFYVHLQGALEDLEQDIIWVAMLIYSNSMSFKKSLDYAKDFIKNGYTIFFLEEFGSLKIHMKAFLAVLKSSFKFLILEKDIAFVHNFRDYNIYPLFRDDWYSSFVGETGYLGIMYYYIFSKILEKIEPEKCIYLCEMHEWEKSLVLARNALGIKTSLFAYQQCTVSRMLLNYFNHPSEIRDVKKYALPQPDRIICNGNLPYSYMLESGWPSDKISIVEALRYSHFREYLSQEPNSKRENVVLLAFSISPEESSSILNMAYEAFKDSKDIEVWIRPHSSLQLEKVFELSQISIEGFPFKIKRGNLSDILSKVRVVVVGESSVSIEAIACGCSVVIVNVPEWINMSPLKGMRSDVLKIADSPRALRELISNIFKESYDSEKHIVEAKRIVSDFFYLNQEKEIPEKFLKLLTKNG